jgi:hypothetical protein
MHPLFWLNWLAAWLGVVSVLAILAVVLEKERRMTAEDGMLRALWKIIVLVVVLAIGSVALAAWAFADEPHKHRSQDLDIHHKFYKTWMMPDNRAVSCCHDQDCAPAQSKLVNGTWYARHSDDEEWAEVPTRKIETERDSPDGRSHLCKQSYLAGTYVYCFLPANGS